MIHKAAYYFHVPDLWVLAPVQERKLNTPCTGTVFLCRISRDCLSALMLWDPGMLTPLQRRKLLTVGDLTLVNVHPCRSASS